MTRVYERRRCCIVRFTRAEWGMLSNFAPTPIDLGAGVVAPSAEALYQAAKLRLVEAQEAVLDAPSPREAKAVAYRYGVAALDPVLAGRRVDLMRITLRLKLASCPAFGRVLDETEARPIVEESRRDDFWGAKPGFQDSLRGRNALGRLLMELREERRDGRIGWPELRVEVCARALAAPASLR